MSSHIHAGIAKARWARLARSQPRQADPLSKEVAVRHAQTLDPVNIPAGAVIDVGCGLGEIPLEQIAQPQRFDFVQWGGEQEIAEATQLPLADASVAFVWSNLCLPWLAQPEQFFTEAHRVLQEGGLLSVTSLGPETLSEIDARTQGFKPRTLGFLDMHDLADMAMRAGFAEPVALRENLNFSYANPHSMLAELRQFGVLATKDMEVHLGQQEVVKALTRGTEPVELNFEVIYLHAWALPPRPKKIDQHWQEVKFS